LLWLGSFAGAVILATLPINIATSAAAILMAEGFRGAMWLGTTAALARLARGKGFTFNLVATILPLAGLWVSKEFIDSSATLLVYAAFIAPIPLAAHIVVRRRPSASELASSAR